MMPDEMAPYDVVTDTLPAPIRVVVVSATGVLRGELTSALDEDFEASSCADAHSAEAAAAGAPHALVVVADDLFNCSVEDLVSRVRLVSPGGWRVAVLVLSAHSEPEDLPSIYHAGADDVCRWPMEPDMFRARVRSLVRVATLEASMSAVAESGHAGIADLRYALAQAVHLINNSVAGVSGRAQLAALTGAADDAGLIPVCLSEARKMTLVLGCLHRLSESVSASAEQEVDLAASSR
jgi:DNA-binding response OmpR family regulator